MDSKMTVEPFSPYKYEEESLASSVLYSGNGPMVIIHIACASAWCSKDSHPLWCLVEDKAVTQAGNVSWRVQYSKPGYFLRTVFLHQSVYAQVVAGTALVANGSVAG